MSIPILSSILPISSNSQTQWPKSDFPSEKIGKSQFPFTPLGLLQHSQEQYKDVISLDFFVTESIFLTKLNKLLLPIL